MAESTDAPPTNDADGDVVGARPEIPYEQAREELAQVVQRLEAGGTTLEESLTLWERGEELAGICQQWLDGARARLQRVQAQAAERQAETD